MQRDDEYNTVIEFRKMMRDFRAEDELTIALAASLLHSASTREAAREAYSRLMDVCGPLLDAKYGSADL